MLANITLNNFRRYEQAMFRFHPRMTVLIGENGKGKTTILDAVAIMLGTYFQGSGIATGQGPIKKNDARLLAIEKGDQLFLEPQKQVYLAAEATIRDNTIRWRRDIGDRGGKARDIVAIGSQDRDKISKGETLDLPLYLYYGSGRLWDIHRDVTPDGPGSQLDAYRFCLDPKSDQRAFERWFTRLSLAEIQKKKSFQSLKAVKEAVIRCIPDATDFYHDVERKQAMILLEEGPIPFNNLSDGYRNMVAMVADIAHRASRLNPHMEEDAPRSTRGVVLIDEIDLHLHPKWQRQVVADLQDAFPQIQFIATTHSPFIVQSLEPGQVIDLHQSAAIEDMVNTPEGKAAPGAPDPYVGRSIEDIVEDLMGIDLPQRSERYQAMYDAAKKYYEMLRQAQNADEEEKARLKTELDRLSAPFSDDVAYYAFLETERAAVGLEPSSRKQRRCDR
ncbi:MAG: AAA family ATPase [Synergistales bacterium]|nr:AAA family ATPase [Synergistales bacterium]